MSINAQRVSSLEIFHARKHILQLLKTQGYDTDAYEGFTLESLSNEQKLDMLLKMTSPQKRVFVKFHLMPKPLHAEEIQHYVDELFTSAAESAAESASTLQFTSTDDFIMLVQEEPSESIKKKIIKIWRQQNIYVNIIAIKRLQFNVTTHQMVPLHEILNAQETAEFLQKYLHGVDVSEYARLQELLPEISLFDPVAQAIGLRPGQICRITRPSPTALSTMYYRVCVMPL